MEPGTPSELFEQGVTMAESKEIFYWNYRVIKRHDGSFGVYEVYYDDFDHPIMRTEDPVTLYGETESDIREDLSKIVQSFDKPVLIDSEQVWNKSNDDYRYDNGDL
jgi:hypothetical protein